MAKAMGDIKNIQGDSGKNKIELLKMKTLIVGNKKKTSQCKPRSKAENIKLSVLNKEKSQVYKTWLKTNTR